MESARAGRFVLSAGGPWPGIDHAHAGYPLESSTPHPKNTDCACHPVRALRWPKWRAVVEPRITSGKPWSPGIPPPPPPPPPEIRTP